MHRILTIGVLGIATIAIVLTSRVGSASPTQRFTTSAGDVSVARLVGDLDSPWAVAPLPDGGALVTERPGRLWRFDAEWARYEVAGVPEVYARNQGGLLDVTLARDFATTRTLYLTYAEPAEGGARTAMARARLSDDGDRLEGLTVLFRQTPVVSGGRHFGSRVLEAEDGTLFVTTGDRGQRPQAQNPESHIGKVIRLAPDGSAPEDNPFVGDGETLPEVFSIGHRNIQGAALDERGRLWTLAHGARGGDEVNLALAGRNYGWPVISYGRHYAGGRIGEGTHKAGLEQPKWYWDPSIAPSGLALYEGDLFPEWQGDLFAGSLKFDHIARLERDGDRIVSEEKLFEDEFARIRDVVLAPDASLWFLAEGDGALYRVIPAEGS